MDRQNLWRHLLVVSSAGCALCGMSLVLSADEPASKPRSNALIYIPKMRADLGPRKLFKPSPGSRAEAEQVRTGMLPPTSGALEINRQSQPAPVRTYQRPAAAQAEQLETARQNYSVIGAHGAVNPTLPASPTASPSEASSNAFNRSPSTSHSAGTSQAAVDHSGAQRAPFIANRGPLLPASAVQRSTLPTRLPQPVQFAKKPTSNSDSGAQFVAVPTPMPALAEPNALPNGVTLAARPIATQSNETQTVVRPSSPLAAEAVHVSQKHDGAITPARQIVTTSGTLADLAQVSLLETDSASESTLGTATFNVPLPAPLNAPNPSNSSVANVIPSASVELPQITPPAVVPNSETTAIAKPIEIPAAVRPVVRPASIPSPMEAPRLSVPVLQPPVPAQATTVMPTDVLLAELEREMTELQTARDLLRKSVDDSDMQSREVSARTNVAQASQLQTLVAQVITKVRAEQGGVQSATSQPDQRTRIVSAEDLPNDFITVGTRLYSKGLFDDAAVAFRAAIQHATTKRDEAYANYLLATALRRQSELGDAAIYYRVVANQTDEPELRDLARWQLKHLAKTR